MLRELNRLDADLTVKIQKLASQGWGWRLAVLLAHSGDSWIWAGGLGLVWLFSRGETRSLAAIFEISVVLQAFLVYGLKAVIRRKRPTGEWGGVYRQYDPHSFPSGHATRAFMLAYLAIALGPAWLGWLMAVWAPLVCLARIINGLHYLSDIVGGAILGLLLGAVFAAVSPLWAAWLPFLF